MFGSIYDTDVEGNLKERGQEFLLKYEFEGVRNRELLHCVLHLISK